MNTARRIAVVLVLSLLTTGAAGGSTALASPTPTGPAVAGAPATATVQSMAELVTPGSGPRVVEQHRQRVANAADVSTQAVYCWRNVSLYANANGRYVTTEVGYGGGDVNMLRARGTARGDWELYYVCRDTGSGLTSFFAQINSGIVSAELGYVGGDYGMLRARSTQVGPWEFYISSGNPGAGWIWLRSEANGRFVSAEVGYVGGDYGMLRARSTQVGPWEYFSW